MEKVIKHLEALKKQHESLGYQMGKLLIISYTDWNGEPAVVTVDTHTPDETLEVIERHFNDFASKKPAETAKAASETPVKASKPKISRKKAVETTEDAVVDPNPAPDA